MDWILIVPGQLSKCFSMMLESHPESCCSSQCLGPGCSLCADNLNKHSAPGLDAPVQIVEGCADRPIQFKRAKPPVEEETPYPSCQCCHKDKQEGLAFLAYNYSNLLDDAACRCSA